MRKLLVAAFALALAGPAAAQTFPGDPAAGEQYARRCAACHNIGQGAVQKIGPYLDGVVGRPVAATDNYVYSIALKDAAPRIKAWTPENLAAWLRNPRAFVVGNMMTFAGVRNKQDMYDLIAYLATVPAP